MRNTRKGGLIWLLTCAPLLWIFIVATNIVSLGAANVQTVPPGYTRDNSDWWSFTRTYGAEDEVIPQEGELQDSNFKFSDSSLIRKHSAGPLLNWEKPPSSNVAMHRRGVPKSATHPSESNQRPISCSKKARSTIHSTCSRVVLIGRAANSAPHRISSRQIYQPPRDCGLGKQLRKSAPSLESPAFLSTAN